MDLGLAMKPRRREEPNETTEMWRAIRHKRQDQRRARLGPRSEEISALERQGHSVRQLSPYQFRINERIDLFPTRQRYHDLKTQRRGSYGGESPLEVVARLLGVK